MTEPIVVHCGCGLHSYTADPENVRAVERHVLPEILEDPAKLEDYQSSPAAYQILKALLNR